ncbi:MAG: 2-amino-4-hydroxy-6-hydroxymethyldihydropteridine diphosphokinase [Pseudomonadota bacterium]
MGQNTVYIGLGTNLGDRKENFLNALRHIAAYIRIVKRSSLYETEPVDNEDQGWFLNMVVQGTTALSCRALLEELLKTEKKLGRIRQIHKGPRVIDLDILLYAEEIHEENDLMVPHPEIPNRGFVLIPLNEIAPNLVHPKLKQDMRTLLAHLRQDKQVMLFPADGEGLSVRG